MIANNTKQAYGIEKNARRMRKRFYNPAELMSIAAMFDISGKVVGACPYGNGHINDTFAITTSDSAPNPKYIMQRLNHFIFKQPELVMDNILLVTMALHKNLAAKGINPLEESLTMIRTRDSSSHYFVNSEGSLGQERTYWRCYLYIDGKTYETIPKGAQGEKLANLVGHAFGMFPQNLAGIDISNLDETIPLFHDGPDRYSKFLQAVEVNYENRTAKCQYEIEFVKERNYMMFIIPRMIESGKIPLRVTHNDTKLNNVRIDKLAGTSEDYDKCILDLDTVMPGTILYDFGDMIRTGASCSPEDEKDLSKTGVDFGLFRQLAAGFLNAMGSELNEYEKRNLVFSARYMTFIIGLRFLTDHLNGDVYFKVQKTDQNLHRARTQFRMVASMEQNASAMDDILDSLQ